MKNKSFVSKLFDGVNLTFLFIVFVATLCPFVYVAAVSLSDPYAVMQNKVTLYPIGFTLDSYKAVLANPAIWTGYKNTILYTVVGTAINLILTTLMAYAISKPTLYARKFFTLMVVFTMFFNGGIIPTYLVVKGLGMVDTMWAVILPTAVSTWNLMVMRTFFSGLPAELEEAAVIDGCNPLQVLFVIVIPLSSAIMVTIGLFYAVFHWNAYFAPLIYLNSKEKYPLQIFMQQILITGETSFNSSIATENASLTISDTVKYATIMVAMLPILMVYPFIQKYFAQGVMIGAVKG